MKRKGQFEGNNNNNQYNYDQEQRGNYYHSEQLYREQKRSAQRSQKSLNEQGNVGYYENEYAQRAEDSGKQIGIK